MRVSGRAYYGFRRFSSHQERKKLVILGTGWAGYSLLKHIDKKLFDAVVVSPRNHFLFTPLLASTTVGTLEFRSIIEPVRNHGFRDEHHFHLSRAIDLDMQRRKITCQSELDPSKQYKLSYDRLVIAVGSLSNTFNVPGVEEYAFFLKEIADAQKIRNRILVNMELATQPDVSLEERKKLLHFVVVGGGPTGVEFSAEFYDFLKQDIERLYPEERNIVKVTLVEANQILSSFDIKLRNYAERKIKQRSQMNLLSGSVVEVTHNSIKLKSGKELPCGLVVWSTGIAPRVFTKSIDVEKDNRGQIVVDEYLRSVSDKHQAVYAIGDCSSVLGCPLPCTAQVAEKQGRYLASALSQKDPPKFQFRQFGMLTYIGEYKAVTETPYAKQRGFASWILWRSAYTTRLGSWRLRLQVPLDWMKTFIYGRDTSRF